MRFIWHIFLVLLTARLLACAISSQAQTTASYQVDSLIKQSYNAPDSVKIKLYTQIAWSSRYTNHVLGLEYGTKALELAEECGTPEQIDFGYVILCTIQRALGNYEEAIRLCKCEFDVCKKFNLRERFGYCYNNLGSIYLAMGDLDQAEENCGISLLAGTITENNDIIGYATQNLGVIYYIKKDYKKAQEYLLQSYNSRKKINCELHKMCMISIRLSETYARLGNYDLAKKFINDIFNHPDFKKYSLKGSCYSAMAEIFKYEGKLDSAYYFALLSENERYSPTTLCESERLTIEICKDRKDFKSMADFCRKYTCNKDSALQATINEQNKQLSYTSDYYKQEQEFIEAENNKFWGTVLIVILTIITAMVAIGFASLRKSSKKIRSINSELSKQQRVITQSINFAQKIQRTMIPDSKFFGSVFSDKFLIYKPRDIVSGDFYWQHQTPESEIIVVADCTGHGVPGAMLSMLGISTLQDITKTASDPAEILEQMRIRIKKLMHQNKFDTWKSDGMDMAIIKIDKKTLDMRYSGAFIPLLLIRDNEILKFKATQNPIGIFLLEKPFANQIIKLQDGDKLYLLSDGFCSQMNDKGQRVKKSQFRQTLLDIHKLPMAEQKVRLEQEFDKWRGNFSQVDDITVAGFAVECKKD